MFPRGGPFSRDSRSPHPFRSSPPEEAGLTLPETVPFSALWSATLRWSALVPHPSCWLLGISWLSIQETEPNRSLPCSQNISYIFNLHPQPLLSFLSGTPALAPASGARGGGGRSESGPGSRLRGAARLFQLSHV